VRKYIYNIVNFFYLKFYFYKKIHFIRNIYIHEISILSIYDFDELELKLQLTFLVTYYYILIKEINCWPSKHLLIDNFSL